MITYERQEDGTLKQVDSPPKRAELVEQRIHDRRIVRVGQLEAEKVTLEARIDELCAENEKLRGRLKASDDGRMRQADNLIDKCHKIARLQGENAKLQAENERLTETLRGVEREADRLTHEAAELSIENAKLRELVRDMCDFFCVVPDEPYVFKEELDFSVEVWRRMRELGIEANE